MKSWPTVELPKLPGRNDSIQVFDSVSKSLVKSPAASATLYVCGITPYDATHIGHASTYVVFDILHRAWLDAGLSVKYAQNVTDVDDPLLERATATGVQWQDLAAAEIELFRSDMTALRVLPPDFYVSVSEHMDEIIQWIARLIDMGAAYKVETDWYFDSHSDDLAIEQMTRLVSAPLAVFAERGGDPDRKGKRNPFDPLLWRGERTGEPAWPASFGNGRPGWHIECLAIARDLLGDQITVQGGGADLIFPHHYMCEVQGRAANDKVFATAHVHAELVSYAGEKMSKSRGNLVFVSKLLAQGVDPMAIRVAILRNHYQQPWEWTDDLLHHANDSLARWRKALSQNGSADAVKFLNNVRQAIQTNLNTPAALAEMDSWADATLAGDASDVNGPGLAARTLDKILGIAL